MAYDKGPAIRPEGLGLAASATLLALSAIWLAAPNWLPGPPISDFVGTQIAAPPPPPPPPPQDDPPPKTTEARPRAPQPTLVKPVIETQSKPMDIALTEPKFDFVPVTPKADEGTGGAAGAGTGVTVETKPPVIVPPQVDPRYAARFQPDYPVGEIRLEREGVVVVRVLIGTDGRVKALEPVSATSEDFLAATRRRAFADWRFKPATRDGVAFEEWKQMRVTFALKNE